MIAIRPIMEILMPISILIIGFAAFYQLVNQRSTVARWVSVVLVGMTIDLICYILLLNNIFPESGKIIVVLQVFGFLLHGYGFLIGIVLFTGHTKWLTKRFFIAASAIPILVIGLMFFHWSSLPTSLPAPNVGFAIDFNVINESFFGIDLLFVGFSIFSGVFSGVLLINMLLNGPPYYKNTIFGLIIAASIIFSAGLTESLGFHFFSDYSILQAVVALNAMPVFLIVFTWKTAGTVSINQQLFKDTMRDGYLILDTQNKIIDYNLAVKNLVGDQNKLLSDQDFEEIFPKIEIESTQMDSQSSEQGAPILYEHQNQIYEITVYPVGPGLGRMVIFHNISDRDQLEDALRKNNIELARSNAYFSSLTNLALSFQTADNPDIIMSTLGEELQRLGLKCFIATYRHASDELEVRYLSENMDIVRIIEKAIGRPIIGNRLAREDFPSLFEVLNSRQIQYISDPERVLKIFLGKRHSKIFDLMAKTIITDKEETSMMIPLIAAEKVIGLMDVWGNNLLEADISPFQIFGSQVGWAMERSFLQEAENQRMEELSHANLMVTALSKVSSILETTMDNDSAFRSLGQELSKIGLDCAIVILDKSKTIATIRYVSFQSELIGKIEQLSGFNLIGHQIPKKFWPGDKVVAEGIVRWYPNPETIFRKLLPVIPEGVSHRVFKLMKGVNTGEICFLPLKIEGEVIGVMPIWGPNLTSRDNTTLNIFGDQIAAIMRRNRSYEMEINRSAELARLNSMILALSGVASQLDSTSLFDQVMDTLGEELKKVNLNCMVGTLDEAKQNMKIEYLTIGNLIKQLPQKLEIIWPEEFVIPRHLWPTEEVVLTKAPYWDSNPIGNAHQMFNFMPKKLFHQAMRMLGMNLNDPVCYLPMINDEDVIGILAVWGKDLEMEDIPALNIFANQVATAIKNSRLYIKAQNEIIERKQTEIQIREALTEKEVLLKEVHHRVKNNLQVISSLLNLQTAEIKDPATLNAFKESQNRVRSMALIHEKLYQSDDLAHIDFSTYLQNLVNSLSQSYRVKKDKVELQVQSEKILLDLDTAIPCGLIVNELVSNSIKYAFPDEQSGKVQVLCSTNKDKSISLIVRDDGVGLPPGFDHTKGTSLGLKLVNSLTRQIDGNLSVGNTKGTCFEITFRPAELLVD